VSTIAFRGKSGDAWYDIAFRYDADIVDLIKTVIPASYRKYDPVNKVWSAGANWAQEFARAAQAAGHDCVGITVTNPGTATGGAHGFWQSAPYSQPFSAHPPPGPQGPSGASSQPPPGFHTGGSTRSKPPPPMPPPPPQLTEGWARELMRRCPPELREKLYKAIARVLHTDLGGDQRLMQELNDARNQVAS
jgi:hypothetical protein